MKFRFKTLILAFNPTIMKWTYRTIPLSKYIILEYMIHAFFLSCLFKCFGIFFVPISTTFSVLFDRKYASFIDFKCVFLSHNVTIA